MTRHFGWCVLLSLVAAVPAWAQTHPLRSSEPSGGAVEPDQPVRPQLPTLTQRAPQQQAAPAQPVPPKPPFTLTPEEEAQVDRVLQQWEAQNQKIKTFDCEFKRWIYDVVFGPPNKARFVELGAIKYASPDRGSFDVKSADKDGTIEPIDPARTEHWISDGKSIFEFKPAQKQLVEHKLPPELQGKAIADGPLPFLFGADAKKLKERYFIRIVTPAGVNGQTWLLAYPRRQQDAANFHHAEFIIETAGMAPYALKLIQPNEKDYTVYQFFNIVVNDPLRLFRGDPFRASTPSGWQKIVEEAPTSPAAQARRAPNEGQR